MRRVQQAPRPDWRQQVEDLGFDFHTIDGAPYWDEGAAWEFDPAEIDLLEEAGNTLHRLCLEAVEHLVRRGDLARLGIPARFAEEIERSWRAREPALYGRFDLAWDGDGAPKLLEYNADTPTALFESSVVQWHWLEAVHPGADQFNSIHEGLVDRWRALFQPGDELHLACTMPHGEDEGTLRYLQATALEAGLSTKALAMQDIGWNAARFVDLDDRPIGTLFKLYPWEWLAGEAFGDRLLDLLGDGAIRVLEPAWKAVLSNKGILPVLWELFPDCPYLLPAFDDPTRFAAGDVVVAKPRLGREGANVSIARLGPDGRPEGAPLLETDGPYLDSGWIYQRQAPLARERGADGKDIHMVIGAWIIGDDCRGLGLREDATAITRNTSRFVPHYFAQPGP